MKRSLLLLTLVGLTRLLFAQGEVLGTVVDSTTGETVPYANVLLMVDSQVLYQTTTNIDGNYLIKMVQPGTYDLKASFVGLAPVTFQNVTITNGAVLTKDFYMGSNMLGPVVVEWYSDLVAPGTTGEVSIITTTEIENSADINPKNTLVAMTPAAYQSDANEPIRFKGAREGGTLYMMDGMRIIGEPYILQNTIGSIQVYTGGVPAKYGDFTGGVIIIETKSYNLGW